MKEGFLILLGTEQAVKTHQTVFSRTSHLGKKLEMLQQIVLPSLVTQLKVSLLLLLAKTIIFRC